MSSMMFQWSAQCPFWRMGIGVLFVVVYGSLWFKILIPT